jgi:hypothetical protein
VGVPASSPPRPRTTDHRRPLACSVRVPRPGKSFGSQRHGCGVRRDKTAGGSRQGGDPAPTAVDACTTPTPRYYYWGANERIDRLVWLASGGTKQSWARGVRNCCCGEGGRPMRRDVSLARIPGLARPAAKCVGVLPAAARPKCEMERRCGERNMIQLLCIFI